MHTYTNPYLQMHIEGCLNTHILTYRNITKEANWSHIGFTNRQIRISVLNLRDGMKLLNHCRCCRSRHLVPKEDHNQAASHAYSCGSLLVHSQPREHALHHPGLLFGYLGHVPFNENSTLWAKPLLTIS